MKTLTKIIILLITLCSAGCWNMYNETINDMDDEYRFFLAVGTTTTPSTIRIYSLDKDGTPVFLNYYNLPDNGSIFNIAVHPTGNYIYVPAADNDMLYTYHVDNDGSLTLIDSKDTGSSIRPEGVIVDQTGRYVYLTCYASDTILVYSISSNGTLTSIGSGNLPNGSGPQYMTFHPSGQYLYVTLVGGNGFAEFQVNNGLLASPTIITIGNPVYEIAVHPNGKLIYVAINSANDYIYKYNRLATGSIDITSQVSYDIPFESNSSLGGISLAFHPNGKNILYMKDGYSSSVFAYQISEDGTFDPNTYADNSPESIGSGRCSLIIHPNGRNVYYTDKTGGNRLIYNIFLNSNGLFDHNYLHKETSGLMITSNPVLIRKKIK